MELLARVKRTISENRMLIPGDKVLVAVSGGPDSVALLDLLGRLRQDYALTLVVAHYHHQLRGRDADLDADYARELAGRYALEFISGSAEKNWAKKKKSANEQMLRQMRYDFLEKSAEKISAQKIALGHNADDLAESFLINLLRGSGMLGLAGMPPVRGRLIRPLIATRREQILDYLNERGLGYRTDKSNRNLKILRNRIRAELVPMLKSYNPEIVPAICRAAELLQEDERFLAEASEQAFARLATLSPNRVLFSAKKFREEPKAIRRRLIRLAIARLKTDLRRIEAGHVFELERLLDSGTAGFELDLPGKLRLRKSYDQLGVEIAAAMPEPGFEPVIITIPARQQIRLSGQYQIELRAEPVETGEFKKPPSDKSRRQSIFSSGRDEDRVALDNLAPPLLIRGPRPGDRIIPLGMKGHRKLKEILQELKVPREQRKIYPLLFAGDELVWIPGFGISEKARLKSGSENTAQLVITLHKIS